MPLRTLLMMVGLAGCGSIRTPTLLDETPQDAGIPVDADPVSDVPVDSGPRPTNLIVEDERAWNWLDRPVDVGSATNRFCFLVGVAGMFKEARHVVSVEVVDGRWWVSGDDDRERSARVRCVTYDPASGITMTPRFVWNQGSAPVDMGPYANQTCALTGIAGVFNGGGELVHAAGEDNRWRLRGTSGAVGVSATARCLTFPAETAVTVGGEENWAQGQPAMALGPAAHRACVLTLFVGSFLGGGESVAISLGADGWALGGGSAQQGVAARARCFHW